MCSAWKELKLHCWVLHLYSKDSVAISIHFAKVKMKDKRVCAHICVRVHAWGEVGMNTYVSIVTV